MFVGLKIVFDVIVYRLRKIEMGNMVGTVTIALALALPWAELGYRTLFAFILNALVYLNNDYVDVELDLESADKDAVKTRFLADNLKAALWAQWVIVGVLAVMALIRDPGLLVPLIVGGGGGIWYSVHLKRMPVFDIAAMIIWGFAMPLCGSPLNQQLGLALALQLGLFSGVFETIQVMRDADEDAAEGVKTTGVVLGPARSLILARVLMAIVTLYALLVIHPIAAAVTAIALVVPFDKKRVETYWNRVKLIYGVAQLLMCAIVYYYGYSSGLLWSIARAAH
jgi:4-hydroxybenzoate polyprenyltransferase